MAMDKAKAFTPPNLIGNDRRIVYGLRDKN